VRRARFQVSTFGSIFAALSSTIPALIRLARVRSILGGVAGDERDDRRDHRVPTPT
jgi:hypothetical protein